MSSPTKKAAAKVAIIAIARDLCATYGTPVHLYPHPEDDNRWPSVTTELAKTGNGTAEAHVRALYGAAILAMRKMDIPVVPVVDHYFDMTAAGEQPETADEVAACIAGLAGGGKATTGLHFPGPTSVVAEDDPLLEASSTGRRSSGKGKQDAVMQECGRLVTAGTITQATADRIMGVTAAVE